MVTVLQISGLCLIAVLFTTLLRRHSPEQAVLLSLLLACGITLSAGVALSPILAQLDAMLAGSGLSAEETAVIGKAAGICCLTQLAADVCRDSGEGAMATAVTLAGKTALLVLALPLAEVLLNLIREVI